MLDWYLDLTKQKRDNFITAGKVLDSYGLKGQVKVVVYMEDLKLLQTVEFFCLGNALLKANIKFLKNLRKSTWIATIAETSNREQARRLKGQLIFLEKKFLPSLMPDEFYYEDLKGLKIKIDGKMEKGYVKDVCDFGSGVVLEVSLDDKEATIYIPFDRDNVGRIDLENRTIILTPIKGLLT